MKIILQVYKSDFPVQELLDAGIHKQEVLEEVVKNFLESFVEPPTSEMSLHVEPVDW